MLPMGFCITMHWQTSGRLVQELNVCTVFSCNVSSTKTCVCSAISLSLSWNFHSKSHFSYWRMHIKSGICMVINDQQTYVAYVMVLSKYMECLFNPLSMLIQNEMTGWFCINPFTLRDTLESIVCYYHTFENNLGINQKLTKYLKESCCLVSNQHFSF